ncbi:MAG: hypothetical protein WDN46_14435 [Methylocella sp.]
MADEGENREHRLLNERWTWEKEMVALTSDNQARIRNLEEGIKPLAQLSLNLERFVAKFEALIDRFESVENMREDLDQLIASENQRKGADARNIRNSLLGGLGGGLASGVGAWLLTHIK